MRSGRAPDRPPGAGRRFEANAFDDDAHVERFFAAHGVALATRPQRDGSFALASTARLGLSDAAFAEGPEPQIWTFERRRGG